MTIGLQRGTVLLKPYDEQWSREFEEEKKRLSDKLGDFISGIEHIGSTSVPDLDAKPLIDMIVPVASLSDVTKYIPTLVELGYEHMPERITDSRAFFPKGPREQRTYHLSFVIAESVVWHDTLKFRDLLRSDKKTRQAYQTLKRDLAERYKDDRYAYTAAKNAFIEASLKR